MHRIRSLSFSGLLVIAATGMAHAGPTITNYNYWPNEARSPNSSAIIQAEPDARRARAKQTRPAPTAPTVNSGQRGCRYIGGRTNLATCR